MRSSHIQVKKGVETRNLMWGGASVSSRKRILKAVFALILKRSF